MHDVGSVQYLPLTLPFFVVLVGVFIALVIWVEVRALLYAYNRAGISSPGALFLLFGSLIGSSINIPIAELAPQRMISGEEIDFYGMHYVVPALLQSPGTIIAINVGGAVIPILVSFYLLAKYDLWGRGVLATFIVAFFCHLMATPVRGVGIAIPVFVPPIIAAIVAIIVSRNTAGPLAYISGSLGVLIGADLLNLGKIQGLGAPVASIGGAGTFDGIFLTGVLAVLLASFSSPRYASARG